MGDLKDKPASKRKAPRFDSSDRVVYTTGEHTVILGTSDNAEVIDASFGFDTQSWLIYAEKVELRGSIKAPGKNISVFCSELSLYSIEPDGPCVIDVAGNSGSPPTSDKFELANGQPGGHVAIFVENLQASHLTKLEIKSGGGHGVSGWDASGVTEGTTATGGKGGDGGNGGTVNFVYRDPLYEFLGTLYEMHDAAWTQRLNAVEEFFRTIVPTVSTAKLSAILLAQHEGISSTYVKYATSLQNIGIGLKKLLFPGNTMISPPAEDLEKTADTVLSVLRQHLDAKQSPQLDAAFLYEKLDNLDKTITKWLDDREEDDELDYQDLLAQLLTLPSIIGKLSQNTALDAFLVGFQQDLSDCVQDTNVKVQNLCATTGGLGGTGGPSAGGPAAKPGSHGVNGDSGLITATQMAFFEGDSSAKALLQIPVAFVHPDQCRMLLRKAEALYFASSSPTWSAADTLLATLERRLCFVPSLVKETQSLDPSKTSSPQLQAQANMEFLDRLTLHGIGQLNASYNGARALRARLALGHDMFNNPPLWVPRLSVRFYEKQIIKQMANLSLLEHTAEAYENEASDEETARLEAIKGLQVTHHGVDQAQAMITTIGGENGYLVMTGANIAFLTRTVQERRVSIVKLIAGLEERLKRTLDWDVQKTLEALASLCFAPTSFNFAVQSASLGYKTLTEITDTEGNHVKKEFVIRKLVKSGKTLQSLQEAYNVNKLGDVSVDDPSALKITAAAEDVRSLIEQFHAKLPKEEVEELKEQLDTYLDLILRRNQDVLNYNMALVSLKEARDSLELNIKREESFEKMKLELNPNLPAVAFWLRDLRDAFRLQVMRLLNFQSRALQFWALMDPTAFGASPGPLREGSKLVIDCSSLVTDYENGMNILYNNYYWSIWPNPSTSGSQGSVIYKLSSAELRAFKTKIQGVHSVPVKLTPDSLTPPPNEPDIPRSHLFAGKYNVRINQVRVWILNVAGKQPDARGRNIMTVDITHMGLETFYGPNGSERTFDHDSVGMQFQFEFDKCKTLDDCTEARVFGQQDISNNYVHGDVTESSVAAMGPFTTWLLEVDTNDNPGIDMSGSGVEVYIEFYGASTNRKR